MTLSDNVCAAEAREITTNTTEYIKNHARLLHRAVQAGDSAALSRLRKSHGLGLSGNENVRDKVQRKDCLAVAARELGFDNWPQLLKVLSLEDTTNFGALLYPKRCGAHSNIWAAGYTEAATIRAEHGGYLLAYKEQFLVVDEHYIRTLGLNPDDPDWAACNWDMAGGNNLHARARLMAKLIQMTLPSVD